MRATIHPEHPLDQAAMLAMRAMLARRPSADFGPGDPAVFDARMGRTRAADGVAYEAATVDGVFGWWCDPADADADAAILYLHGGAYVLVSAQAHRNCLGEIAALTLAPAYNAYYGRARGARLHQRFPTAQSRPLNYPPCLSVNYCLIGETT